jgi:hypothetical protein
MTYRIIRAKNVAAPHTEHSNQIFGDKNNNYGR